MGWNSFDSYGCYIYEEIAMKELKVFKEKYKHLGYEYFVLDNGWFSEQETVLEDNYRLPLNTHTDPQNININEYGIVKPSNSYFPDGFDKLVDYCNKYDIKFGVHLMRGIPQKAVELDTPIKGTEYSARDIADTNATCSWCDYMFGVDMSKPGAQEYYNSVIEQFAKWGISFIKVDDVVHRPSEIEGYVRAIENVEKPIVLSLSPGGDPNKAYLSTYQKTNMLRITSDIWDKQEDILESFKAWKEWQGLENKEFYPDLDMIPFGELNLLKRETNQAGGNDLFQGQGDHHFCHLSKEQKETFITQRAMAATPLMIGGSLQSMDEHSYNLLSNSDMIKCNQNGIMGKLVNRNNSLKIWLTPEQTQPEKYTQYQGANQGWIGIFNVSDKIKTFEITQDKLGLIKQWYPATDRYLLRDIWQGGTREIGPEDSFNIEIPSYGVTFYRFDKID